DHGACRASDDTLGDVVFRHVCTHKAHIRARRGYEPMAASGILTIADLTDKRVGIGPQGGTTGIYMPEFFKVLKVNPMSRTGSWTRTAGVMATVDAQSLNSSMLATAALRASAH